MYQLYSIPGSCSTGVHTLLNALDIPVDIIMRDDVKDYSSLVPTNQVPALRDGDNLITEGAAIVMHLLDKHEVDTSTFGNSTHFFRWLMFNYSTLHPAYSKLFAAHFDLEDSVIKHDFKVSLAHRITSLWQIVEEELGHNLFFFGDKPCIVDYLFTIYVRWGAYFPDVSIEVGDKVLALVGRVNALPEFQHALKREGLLDETLELVGQS